MQLLSVPHSIGNLDFHTSRLFFRCKSAPTEKKPLATPLTRVKYALEKQNTVLKLLQLKLQFTKYNSKILTHLVCGIP